MFVLPSMIGAFLLVNLLCACISLGVGIAAGAWFFGGNAVNVDRRKNRGREPNEEAKRAAERAAMAMSRVADVAKNVASDVGDHTAKMKAISDDLAGVDRASTSANGAVFSALDQMLGANRELQERLENAEKQLAEQAAELRVHESEARTDSLTGLSNRRAFDDELNRRFNEWERNYTPCTLVLLDIDFFKKFNDTHGHQVGDEVLRQVAKVLRAQSREMDLPCRYGGEEFGVILPATDAVSARKVAERIRTAIEQSTTVYESKKLKVTCSVGMAEFSFGGDVDQLIRRADEALYTSKKAGRNCGHWHNGVDCVPVTDPVQAAIDEPTGSELPHVDATAATSKDAPKTKVTAPGPFFEMLKRRVTESHRFGVPLSLLVLKLEEYEVFSRKYGIVIARQILDSAEPAMEKAMREMDLMARLDRGEFVVMLPGSTEVEARQIADRMRAATTHCVLPMVDRELQLRFRRGIAELKSNETAQEALARARHAVIAPPAPHQAAKA